MKGARCNGSIVHHGSMEGKHGAQTGHTPPATPRQVCYHNFQETPTKLFNYDNGIRKSFARLELWEIRDGCETRQTQNIA